MKIIYRYFWAFTALTLLSGCVAEMTKTLEDVNAALAKPLTKSPSLNSKHLARITPEQVAKVDSSLTVKIDDSRISTAIQEASGNIKEMVKITACFTGISQQRNSPYTKYGAPGSGNHLDASPMYLLKYHNKTYCLDVVRIHGWKMLANNALEFEVILHAEDSGEGGRVRAIIVKQPSGEWLFTQFTHN